MVVGRWFKPREPSCVPAQTSDGERRTAAAYSVNQMPDSKKSSSLRFPVVSHGAEFLVQGLLMRRNILAYKAPPNNEGYDLICIHPDPRKKVKPVRVQVKSRYQTDCDRNIIVPRRSRGAFDFVIAAFLNVGYFYRKRDGDKCEPEFFTLPATWIEQHRNPKSLWGRVSLKQAGTSQFKNDRGFELIARKLGINYPARPGLSSALRGNTRRRRTNSDS